MTFEQQLEKHLNPYRNISESLNRKMFNPKLYKDLVKEPVHNPGEKNVWSGFLKMLQAVITSDIPNCRHTIFKDERHRIFQGHFFYYIEFKKSKDVSRLIKAVTDFAHVITLEQHHQDMLKVYSERIKNQF